MRRSASLLALLVTAAAAAAPMAASAADMPVPAPAYVPSYQPAIYNWTGIYFGGEGGVNALDDSFTDPTVTGYLNPGTHTHVGYFGLIGGAQVGADYQFAPIVIGIEGTWLTTNLNASAIVASPVTAPAESERSTTYGRWYATATGRLGWAANDLLFYAKGGAAWARQDYSQDVLTSGEDTSSQSIAAMRTGFTVGGGLEYELTEHVSAVFEYDFLDFGTKTYNFSNLNYATTTPGVTAKGLAVSISDYIHELMVGINFRFN